MKGHFQGFEPVFDENSRILILGSFPSVKSREEGFYYGNPQNRFWKTVCGYFQEQIPASVKDKREFLLRRKIALWDVVSSCSIEGSSDTSICEEVVADIPLLFKESKIEKIFCNGKKSYSLLCEHFPEFAKRATLLPSTSPANPRFSADVWRDELSKVFLPDCSITIF